ncbi:chitobiosyldiphosphodolichol beta-mannosyltransferase [Cimex lectularius]|uniref:Beta-1,4-mannosyltransferase n=1 Tax=Cimex lectularius TaxID=79782 RepID=A0A8I6REQ3_CIMLE|nr:chitobiosyldiphosphodolichol beta-mannosyltransferase [Cimex lectularius]
MSQNVCIVGLSDLGRSPRFQYHCISLAREGFHVDVVAYKGAKPKKALTDHKNVNLKYLPSVPDLNKYFPRILAYGFKVIWQSLTLLCCLLFNRRPHYVLTETPPALPVFAIVWFYCLVARCKFIIDWHNYAYSIMALTLGEGSPLVQISYWFESFFGKKAHANFCVTSAMKNDLKNRWAIEADVLYDRAPEHFRRATVEEKHRLFTRLAQCYPVLGGPLHKTAFTEIINGETRLQPDRPGLLVSSTSWTEDEDFNILLSALIEYDKSERESLPVLFCVITGRGPLKEYYTEIIQGTEWNRVKILTPWLEDEDYPLLLGSADLGVSLHTSSSGVDLPMKVVDMYGCSLPVLAMDFNCVSELVRHGENGYVFKDQHELTNQLLDWFSNFPDNGRPDLQKNIENFQKVRWHENWVRHALPVFQK